MDGLIQAVTGSGGGGGIIQKLLPWIMGGTAVSGTVGNILGNKTRNQVLQQQIDYTKQLQNLTPAQLTQMIAQIQQPLSDSLTRGVGNTVSAQLAERGLSQAPGIFASSLAQGLAPYQLQEQQLAQQALFQKLGLPISSRPSPFGPYPQQTNTNQIWQSLAQRFMNPSGGATQLPGNTTAAGLDNILFPGLTPDIAGGGSVPNMSSAGGDFWNLLQSGIVPSTGGGEP